MSRRIGTFALALSLAMTAACSSGSTGKAAKGTTTSTTTGLRTTSVQPAAGHGSPGAAVAGFAANVQRKDWAGMCTYYTHIPPAVDCPSAFAKAGLSLSGFTVGDVFLDGNRALVVVVADEYCAGGQCSTNHDASAGLPTTDAGFAAALRAVSTSGSSPVIPCVEVGGKWYLDGAPEAPN